MKQTLLTLTLALTVLHTGAAARADTLLITEVVTDPQADHSESAGGNGTRFDFVPGTGTISSVDEFVELSNTGPAPVDLTGYTLDLIDTTPSRFVFGSGGNVRFSPGSGLTALLSGGYVLVGNPPGALNNALTIELRDAAGQLCDRLVIADGNATGAEDEAVARLWSGTRFLLDTSRGPITPLAPPTPSPVPDAPGLVLVAISALAAARASARRDRRATSQRPPGSPSVRRRLHRTSSGVR